MRFKSTAYKINCRTPEGWLYVAVVLDLYSRRVVGWSMQSSMTSQLVADALMMAVWRRGKADQLLHHSDQGSQYTSDHFQRLLAEQGIVCSMSRAGEVWDNSAMESFFSTLKTERVSRKIYRTRSQARSDVFDYIESFYNEASHAPPFLNNCHRGGRVVILVGRYRLLSNFTKIDYLIFFCFNYCN